MTQQLVSLVIALSLLFVATAAMAQVATSATVEEVSVVGHSERSADPLDVETSPDLERRGRASIIVGWITFGSAWFGSTVDGIVAWAFMEESGYLLAIPVVGPFIYAGQYYSHEFYGIGSLSFVAGVIQLGGLTTAIVGHVVRARNGRRQASRLNFAVVPDRTAGGGHLQISGVF